MDPDPDEFVLLEVVPNAAIAGVWQSILEEVGIPCNLPGDYLMDQVAETQQLAGGAEVFVPRARLEEARRVIASLKAGAGATAAAGPCPKCGEAAEPGFQVCWKCGAPITSSDRP